MPKIFLHGLGQTPASWDETIGRLKSAERSLCPDLAGMCRDGRATYGTLYERFAKLCGSLDERIDFCGLSLGGVLALHYAAEHPEK